MDQRVSIITLGVSDLKKSREFYDALGWEAASDHDSEEFICYNLHSMAFALYPLDKLAEDAKILAPAKGQYSPFSMAYNVRSENEVEAALNEAKKAGATIVKQAEKVFWGGYSGYFADPDGYLWEVAFNPFSPLGQNGEFQWGGVE